MYIYHLLVVFENDIGKRANTGLITNNHSFYHHTFISIIMLDTKIKMLLFSSNCFPFNIITVLDRSEFRPLEVI